MRSDLFTAPICRLRSMLLLTSMEMLRSSQNIDTSVRKTFFRWEGLWMFAKNPVNPEVFKPDTP
jgi:hypothetical protein